MTPARIESPLDPRIADYRVVSDGALLRQRGLFVVEGRGNVRRLIHESPYQPRSMFLSEPAAAAFGDVLRELAADVPVFVAPRHLLSQIAGFDIHRGCLALCARPVATPAEAIVVHSEAPSVIVVLEDLTDPDNVGTVFRNARAFGADAVLLSPNCCDALYRKAIRVSMGAALCVPTARFESWPDGLDAVSAASYQVIAFDPGAAAVPLATDRAWPARVALLFGTEGQGISAAALARSDECVRIDMAPGFDSLNVGTASGIALHEVFRARGAGVRA